MSNVEVVHITRKSGRNKFENIEVGLLPIAEGLLIRDYELVFARDKSGNEVTLTRLELMDAETEADLIWWGVA